MMRSAARFAQCGLSKAGRSTSLGSQSPAVNVLSDWRASSTSLSRWQSLYNEVPSTLLVAASITLRPAESPTKHQQSTRRKFSNLPEVKVSNHRVAQSSDPLTKTTRKRSKAQRHEQTQLVDSLLDHTQHLMMYGDSNLSAGPSSPSRHHLIAFSGGVDSSLVASLIHQVAASSAQPTGKQHSAVLGLSPAVPQEQVDLAIRVANQIGIELQQVHTTEGGDEMYIANEGEACLACKTHLYSTLQAIVQHAIDSSALNRQVGRAESRSKSWRLYNGTNADDLKDPTRLGLIAARQFNVLSPISHITKAQVREAAQHLGLPNWNYAASPCLRSRLALGVEATQSHLKRIELAERHVRSRLTLNSAVADQGGETIVWNETHNLRVRLFSNNRACIEVDAAFVPVVEALELDEYMVYELSFASVQVRPFRSGSVAAMPAPTSDLGAADDDEEESQIVGQL